MYYSTQTAQKRHSRPDGYTRKDARTVILHLLRASKGPREEKWWLYPLPATALTQGQLADLDKLFSVAQWEPAREALLRACIVEA